MDVGAWLRDLRLGQYEGSFRDAAIDAETLPELTDGDLEKIGVLLGHRKRMLKSIAELDAAAKAPAAAGSAPARPTASSAERRQLTVMFCDLVGSTALSARFDPEDMGDIIRAYQDACSGAIARYDGFVAKFMGDGVLAYFGYPRAHEDDAELAARAGLEIVAAVAKLETRANDALQVRIGIATGVVVVGDLIGQGSAQEQAVVGETPNLAARLQALAEPGGVVIAESTRRLLGGTFELKSLGVRDLKGFEAPVAVWLVVRQAEIVSRFEASRSERMTPFVGREKEVALLVDRWGDAVAGEGQVVLLSGEAGVGKSRILAALCEQIGGGSCIPIRYQCSSQHVNEAFHPIVGQLSHAAGFAAGQSAQTRLDKLEATIARSGVAAEQVAPYLASLLSIPSEGRYPRLEMAPAEVKERAIAALIELFVGLTKDAPVLALLEDVHWIDPTSLDVFDRIVDRLQGLRALLVVTARPEFASPWAGRVNVTALWLNRFGRRQAVAMIDRVTGGKALPTEVLEQIVAKTDGVPLFVEELTKTVIESGLLREEGDEYVLAAPLTQLAIPSSLHDSLMARLDRLAHVKEIAQVGAAIGREFTYRLLDAVSPIKGPALQDALALFMTSELINARGRPPEATYAFKHALVRDAAYESLLRSRRQRIHADIARALVERLGDRIDAAPAVVAHHYAQAGLAEPAARYWLTAAELALSRSDHAEAERYAQAGLAMVANLADGADRRSLELALHLARANALTAPRGFTAPETVAALTSAKRLLDAGVGSDLQRFSVLFGLWAANYFGKRMEPTLALALASEIVEIAERQVDTVYKLVAYRLRGMMMFRIGQHREALESLHEAEHCRDPARDKLLSYRFGVDPGLVVLGYKCQTLLFLGLLDEARLAREQLRRELALHSHAPTVAACTFFAVVVPELMLGDAAACERDCADLVAYCTEKKVEQMRLVSRIWLACARAHRKSSPEEIAASRAAIQVAREAGGYLSDSGAIWQLADALAAGGDAAGAEEALDEGFAFVEQSGELFWLADLHRLDGRVALMQPQPDRARAEACFIRAISIARQQESRLLELRAAVDLARLWRGTRSAKNVRALLEPILAAIDGGETTGDVRDARTLLVEAV